MNSDTENLVLEILRRMQADMAIVREDMRGVKTRLSSIEARLERIAHRLALHDPGFPPSN